MSVAELSAAYQSRYWKSPKEYRHMLWNNLVLFGVWALMCWCMGAALFFSIYLLSVSIAGGLGILIAQRNISGKPDASPSVESLG